MSKNSLLLERVKQAQVLTPLGMPTPIRAPLSSLVRREGFPRQEITKLVQRLFFEHGHAGGPGVVCFCGMSQDDRSSWICARAAEYLASKVDASVCLVDADFRSPRLHTHFGIGNQPGLAAALAGEGPVRLFVTSVASTNLSLVPGGSLQPGSKRLEERLHYRVGELRQEFDYVFVSGPAVSNKNEAAMLGKLSDGMVMIVATGWLPNRLAQWRQAQLRKAGVAILGTILDDAKLSLADWLSHGFGDLTFLHSLTGRNKQTH